MQIKNGIVNGSLRVNNLLSAEKLNVNTIALTGSLGVGGDILFTNTGKIHWNSATYQQRILITDDSTANTAVFTFQQSTNSGSSWSNLLTIYDNGNLALANKIAIRAVDTWLRINESSEFTAGIYTGTSILRSDSGLQVGASGQYFYANNSGQGYFSGLLTLGNYLKFTTNNWPGDIIASNASGKKRYELYSNSNSGAVAATILRVYTDDTGNAYSAYTFGIDNSITATTFKGNATSATKLTTSAGSATQPIYFSDGKPVATTYQLKATLNAGAANRIAYYPNENTVEDYTSTVGSSTKPMYLNAGVPTASNSTVGADNLPMYLKAGVMTAVDIAKLRTNLGLSNAMHFIGVATAAITDGSKIDPVISGYTFANAQAGDVIINSSGEEFVWTIGGTWERLGRDSNFKIAQDAVADPTASGNTITFIDTISQNANGVITTTKKTVRSANSSQSGVVTTGEQTFAGAKTFSGAATFNGNVTLGNAASDTITVAGSATFSAANGFTYSGIGAGSDDIARYVWFSHSSAPGRPVYDADFKYNPSTNVLSVGSISGSAAKLTTARTIALGTAVSSTATSFDGSANITIPITSVKEAYLSWGGRDLSGTISPLDAALSSIHSANRLAFSEPEGVTIEYTTDGSTWTSYGSSDSTKVSLISGGGTSLGVGKVTSGSSSVTSNYKLRITLNAVNMGIYTRPRKLLLNISSGASKAQCLVEYSTIGTPTTFSTLGTYTISGWSGWNSIPVGDTIATFGGGSTQTSNCGTIRLTFNIATLHGTASRNFLNVQDIMLFGDTFWDTPSNMAKTGHLYSYNSSQEATFPAKVTATSFSGIGSSLTQLNASNISSGTLAIGRGGTGRTSWTAYGLVYASSTSALSQISTGTSGYVLQSGGSSAAPSWIQATNSNTGSTIVKRDSSGNFSAGTITATLSGNSSTATALTSSAGSGTQPVYFSGGKPAATTYALKATVNAGTTSKLAYYSSNTTIDDYTSTTGATNRPIYLNAGVPTQCATPTPGAYFAGVPLVNTDGVMEVGRYIDFHPTNDSTLDYHVRIDSGTSTTQRAFTFGSAGGEFVTHTASTAIGGTTRPVYVAASGAATAITSVAVAYGGTGKTSWTANRMIYPSATTTLAQAHYISSDRIAINSTSAPRYNFYVSGSSYLSGALTVTGVGTFSGTLIIPVNPSTTPTTAGAIWITT